MVKGSRKKKGLEGVHYLPQKPSATTVAESEKLIQSALERGESPLEFLLQAMHGGATKVKVWEESISAQGEPFKGWREAYIAPTYEERIDIAKALLPYFSKKKTAKEDEKDPNDLTNLTDEEITKRIKAKNNIISFDRGVNGEVP